MVDYVLIGSRIKAKRKEKGITQEKLAEKLSVSVGYISQLERGTTKISLDTLAKISAVTDCEIADFISGSSSKSNLYAQEEFTAYLRLLDGKERAILLNQLKSYVAFRNSENQSVRP
ncbi:MAG: helix-turn-helix transcriptional regulator [Oscillospiraceae bacterium]|nr:helix-turn-helix transcriptional regulator [Oscillospiraceae bacterium]